MSRGTWGGLALSASLVLGVVPSSAADLDERVLEPELAAFESAPSHRVQLEVQTGRGAAEEWGFAGFVNPSVAASVGLLGGGPLSLSLATALERPGPGELELGVPLALETAAGPLALAIESGYLARPGDDELALEVGLSFEIGGGLSLLGAGKATATPRLGERELMLRGGAEWQARDGLTVMGTVGEGARDTPFEMRERLAWIGASLAL